MSDQDKTPRKSAPKKPPRKKAAAKAPPKAASRKTAPHKAAARKGKSARSGKRRGPSSADIAALIVLALTVSLAACNGMNGKGKGQTTDTKPGVEGQVTVRFLDVGQGDAILVRSPEGKTMLIDGGRSTVLMADHMKTYGIDKIDVMVATHADADHIAGLVTAAAAKPTLFINNGLGGTTKTWERLVAALQAQKTTFKKASNQVINLGSVKVQVIAPPPGMGKDQNDNSVGVALQFGEFRALMTGDSELKETAAWLEQDKAEITGPFQAYKSIHHGAANGDNAAWLAAVRPENVVISVGENNYGHPTAAALDLYKQNGIRIYRTDQNGTVTFTGNSDGTYTVNAQR
ncbi:ComEC/Rec2 family competence protein [Deinococcus arenicola]|uniref:ComEC/Rec2 family competence protein n=1 Tax=Deinococcus arenicola TaxID=2994950 RepID=A0ABU4DTS2_9DEIO|nr:ComEC/Rec2 family competence protein [Deinococcus sp. ZS9-10]MDV6375828.1 ComEC/Rec2 family competence protein [Deinococcus sp. ZS9-10]